MVPPIQTTRFELVSMSLRFMQLLVAHDLAGAEVEIGAIVPVGLPEELDHFLQFRIADLTEDPTAQPWLGRAIVLIGPDGASRIVGSCGFHSPPGPEGRVEVGYKVQPEYRRQGVASEAVRALFDWAHEQGVDRFRASVAPGNVGSLAIVNRLGFRQVGVQIDDIDGKELVFELDGWPSAGRTRGYHEASMSDTDRDTDRGTDRDFAFDTLAVHAGAEPDELTGAVSPPIYQTSTFAQDGVGRPRGGYEYARSQNPTRERLERAVAALEGGAHGIAFASGSAATAAIAELAGPGEEIVVGDDVYGGTFRYLERVRRGAGVETRYVDLASGQDALWEALSDRTRLVWFETPSNPHLKVVDIAATVATVARRAAEGGRRPLVVVDNTFASPALQRPLLLGADVVFHSATKYLAGHSDTILGVAATSDGAVAERLRFLQNAMGAVPGPLDCFLVLRGLRTLHLRMERHGTNAVAVTEFLEGRADVAAVHYPAMGGMVSFLPAAGGRHGRTAAERAVAIAEGTRLFTLAESLGGVESLIEVPAAMTHLSVAGSPLEVSPALVRLSVGIEDVGDLIADLSRALDEA